MKFLQGEGPVISFLNRLIDMILLSTVCFLCCLPVVTIGASFSALYDVTMKWALHKEVSVFSTFFRAFAHNLKKGTILFLIAAACGLFIGIDLWSAFQWNTSARPVFIVVILAIGYFYLAEITHLFPVLAYFDDEVKVCIKKAFLLSMKNGIFTVFIMIMNILPVLLILVMPAYFGQILFLWFVIGNAFAAWLNSLHLVRLFDPEAAKKAEKEFMDQSRLVQDEKRNKNGKS